MVCVFYIFQFILTNIFTEKKNNKYLQFAYSFEKKLNNCNFLGKVKNIKVQDYNSPKIKTKNKVKIIKDKYKTNQP